ncbi:MAG: glycosyltransferase family 39 protein [Acidobacteriota bacterium]
MTDPAPDADRRSRTQAAWLLLALIVAGSVAVRLRLLDIPLERDEGEYAYAGQLLLQGVPPYVEAFNMKNPGVYVAYAVAMGLLGETVRAIHGGAIAFNAAAILMVFLLGLRLAGRTVAVAAAAAFAFLSLSASVLGFSANSEHFLLLPALGGLLVLDAALRRRRNGLLVLAGVLLGLSYVMKQHGAAFVALGAVWLLLAERAERPLLPLRAVRRLLLLAAGAAAPFALVCLWLWGAGAFPSFFFWTFRYARHYVGQVDIATGFALFGTQARAIVAAAPLLWALAAVGLATLSRGPAAREQTPQILSLAGLSFLAICPGLLFRSHYFILLLPAAALLAGVAVENLRAAVSRRGTPALGLAAAGIVLGASLATALWGERDYLFRLGPEEISRLCYGPNPFVESVEVSRYIREHSAATDRVAVLGSEPQIFFYARRRSATGFIYTYALMEPQPFALAMQRRMAGEIARARPRHAVWIGAPTSWLRRPESHDDIFRWWGEYRNHYRVVGIGVPRGDAIAMRWGPASETEGLESPLVVYERID